MRLLLLLTLCFAPTPLRAQTGNYSDASLERLNLKFRSLYARARSQRIVGVSPILIALKRVIGMAGVLDSTRFRYFIAEKLGWDERD